MIVTIVSISIAALVAALLFREFGRKMPKSLLTAWLLGISASLFLGLLCLQDYLLSHNIELAIKFGFMAEIEEFNWLLMLMASTDRRVGVAVVVSLISVIAVRIAIPRADDSDALGYRGSIRYVCGDLQGALADYNYALTIDPEDVPTYFSRAQARCRTGNYQGAIEDFDRGIQLDPGQADVEDYHNRGNAHYELGNYASAIADYDRALSRNSRDSKIYYNRGNAYFRLGDWQQAIANYDQAIALKPNYTEAYNNLSLAQSKSGDLQGTELNCSAFG